MDRKQLKWRLLYYWQYFPFTLNTVLCGVAAWAAFKLLYKPAPKGDYPSPFMPFIILMGKLAFWLLVALVLLSMLSTLASYFYYAWLRASKGVTLNVEFATETKKGKTNKLYLIAQLEGAFRPILGFIKGRLYYDDNIMTDRFALMTDKRRPRSLRRLAVSGKSRLYLPDIKEYDLKGGFIYFQDMLHIFSLAVEQPVSGHFYQPPVLTGQHDAEVYPKKTENMDVRIEQLRRVEGEYLNYKDFESGDDVRRIVWKVYAKNRDLVVRIPEMFEPYASHLYFHASFYADVKAQWLADGYMKEMLNYYKNCVWTVYDTLSKKEWEMRYIPDQSFNLADMPEDERPARIITNSDWHRDRSLRQYFNPRTGAVLCISSFTSMAELQEVLEHCDASTVVYFVKASGILRSFVPLTWISRLIFLPPQDRLSKLRARWTFSPMRLQVQKREKEIEKILQASKVTYGVI
ncbi:hypothetical protein GCM10023093_24400 [Nemorincola caseinilytica]|uniref:DUF58 domain-containing protein n=1 Tax=Nemorincola caseinilytica TaxID=2054315 RepID=A0ABP8NMM2_9BACT